MKSVLISIQPKWCELISNGKKTVEVRKTRPKIDTPFKCYIYCTNSSGTLHSAYDGLHYHKSYIGKNDGSCINGKVIGEFVCDCIANYEAELWDDETFERIQEFFEPDDFAEYGEYEYKTIADNGDDFWKENMLCTSSCLTIEELRKYVGCGFATFYGWHISDLVIYDKPKDLREFFKYCGDDPKCEGCEAHYYSNTECGKEDYCCSIIDGCKPLKRPPQSWCYIELLKEGAE